MNEYILLVLHKKGRSLSAFSLLDNSMIFDSAYQQHGYTVTGPGHFAIGTGIYPGPGGVLGNDYYDFIMKKF